LILCSLAEMMHCPPSEIRKWKSTDVFLMLEFFKRRGKPVVQEITDVETMGAIFGAETHG